MIFTFLNWQMDFLHESAMHQPITKLPAIFLMNWVPGSSVLHLQFM